MPGLSNHRIRSWFATLTQSILIRYGQKSSLSIPNLLRSALMMGVDICVESPWFFIGYCSPFFDPALLGFNKMISDPFPLLRAITTIPWPFNFFINFLNGRGDLDITMVHVTADFCNNPRWNKGTTTVFFFCKRCVD